MFLNFLRTTLENNCFHRVSFYLCAGLHLARPAFHFFYHTTNNDSSQHSVICINGQITHSWVICIHIVSRCLKRYAVFCMFVYISF